MFWKRKMYEKIKSCDKSGFRVSLLNCQQRLPKSRSPADTLIADKALARTATRKVL